MGWARAQGTTGISGFAAPQGEGHGFDPAQGCEGMWLPTYLGTSLAAWYKADAGCYTDAACLFASASSQYLSKTSPTFAPTTKMTIAFDYKPTSLAASHTLVARWGVGNNQFAFVIASDGSCVVYISASDADASNYATAAAGTFSVGVNTRGLFVYDGTLAAADRAALFIDGAPVALVVTGTIPTSLNPSTAALEIGTLGGAAYSDGALARLGFSSQALSGAALTAAHTSTFWADMTAARQADWFSFYNLCEASSTRVDSTGLNNLTPTNGPTVAAGPGEGLATNNSPIKRWEDQSGNGKHRTQSTIASQPLWIASGQNGRPVVRGDGVNDYMSVSLTRAQPFAVFAALKFTTSGAIGDTKVLFGGATAAEALPIYRHWPEGDYAIYGVSTECVGATASDTSWHTHTSCLNGASSYLRLDAAANAITPTNPGPTGITSLSVFAREDATQPCDADVGEDFLLAAVPTTPQQASAESYLRSRWGTP